MSLYRQINWGIIGCGNVTEVKSGPAFSKVANSQLIAVMRRNEAKARDYAKRHRVERFYTDANQLINDAKVNAIYIATPPDSHALYAINAMKAGKAVYVEKPMAKTYEECLAMIACSKNTGVPLFIAFYRRALPYYLKIKEILDSKVLGDISSVELKLFKTPGKYDLNNLPWRVIPKITGGGYFVDLASHQLDIFNFYFGEGKLLSSTVSNQAKLYEAEDMVSASIEYEGGLLINAEWDFASSREIDRTIISGTKGQLSFSFFSGKPIHLTTDNLKQTFDIKAPMHIQMPMISFVVDELSTKGKGISNKESAASTTKLMEDILRPYYTIDKAC